MNFKLLASVLAVGLATLAGCAADNNDSSSSDSSDLSAAAEKLVGAYHAKAGTATGAQSFSGIVFNANGSFFGDLDTGIKCITAPCPSSVRLEGTFALTGKTLTLTPKDASTSDAKWYGKYEVVKSDDGALAISRAAGGATAAFSNVLTTESSYCAEPTDCDMQGLMHPMCAPGGWTCSSSNACSFSCGFATDDSVWPADKKELIAENKGGGFVAPPPPGSTCGVGVEKFTFDVATSTLSWEVCKWVDSTTPMHMVTGSKVLTAAQLKKVDAAMNAVKVTHGDNCGADKPLLDISVATATHAAKTYTDNFYECRGGGATYVDNIDGVFSTLSALSN
jgi:hypothetical protein